MSKLAFEAGVISIVPAADQTLQRGFAVTAAGAIVSNFTTVLPLGVIVDGQPTTGRSSVAVASCGYIVKVKLAATPGSVVVGSILRLDPTTAGTFSITPGPGTARIECARALEAGAANELIDAVLYHPVAGT